MVNKGIYLIKICTFIQKHAYMYFEVCYKTFMNESDIIWKKKVCSLTLVHCAKYIKNYSKSVIVLF